MSKSFQEKGYKFVEGFLEKPFCDFATDYFKLKHELTKKSRNAGPQPELGLVDNGSGLKIKATSFYNDYFSESLLTYLKPRFEKETGLELTPTYSFSRVYVPGSQLTKHTDRPSCEISGTLCLGFDYLDQPEDYRWKIGGEYDGEERYMAQNPGDIMIYKGCDLPHMREGKMKGARGSYHVQVFLHYIDKNGPHYPQYEFDERPGLGWPQESKPQGY